MKSRIMLVYPPASSVWHLPLGIAQLASVLQEDGHEVTQRYSHILGLEHVLLAHGGSEVETALAAIRNPHGGIQDLYQARLTFEGASQSINTPDRFSVQRNNVSYVSSHYDGSIAGVFKAIEERGNNLWYDYFVQTEVPFASSVAPQIYGISVADERQLIPACILASLIKKALPNTLVVLGGNVWSRLRQAFEHPDFGRFSRFCDAVVYREGFQPIQELALHRNPSAMSGTVWFDAGQARINPGATVLTPFENLPTPIFEGGARQWSPDPVYPLYTMSNCPMSCGFCAIAAGSDSFLGQARSMSPARIAEHMIALGGRRFDFTDETFSVQRQLALGEELRKRGYQAEWQCYLTVTDNLLDPSLAARLYQAGCRSVQLGLETLSSESLVREHKKWNHPENYGRILKNLRDAGIQTHVFVIVGLPGEPLHSALKWPAFFDQYGDSILTIKASRYRVTRLSPEEQSGAHSDLIEMLQDRAPMHLNREFKYRAVSRKRIEAMRDLLERVCREHWAYSVTSTIPWWINRGRYSWDELRALAGELPAEKEISHWDVVAAKTRGIVRDELGVSTTLSSYDDILAFSRTL